MRTTTRRATRRISANPCQIRPVMDGEHGEGGVNRVVLEWIASAVVCTAGARPAGRCAIITADGSTASTVSGGS